MLMQKQRRRVVKIIENDVPFKFNQPKTEFHSFHSVELYIRLSLPFLHVLIQPVHSVGPDLPSPADRPLIDGCSTTVGDVQL